MAVVRTKLPAVEVRKRIDRHIGVNAPVDAAGEGRATEGRTWQDGFRVRYEIEDVAYVVVGRVVARENHSLILLRIRRLRDSLLWSAVLIAGLLIAVLADVEHPFVLGYVVFASLLGAVILPHLQIVPTKVAEGLPDQLARVVLGEARDI